MAGMGELTLQQRDQLANAILSLRRKWKEAIAIPLQRGERIMIDEGGAREVEGRVIYRGPNNIGYVPITNTAERQQGAAQEAGTATSDGRARAPHAKVRRKCEQREEFTSDQLQELSDNLDLPYGVKQLRFEIRRTRTVLQDEGGLS